MDASAAFAAGVSMPILFVYAACAAPSVVPEPPPPREPFQLDGGVAFLEVSADGRIVARTLRGVQLLDPQTGEQQPIDPGFPVLGVAMAPGGTHLATFGAKGAAVVDLATGKERGLNPVRMPDSGSFDPQGTRIAIPSVKDGTDHLAIVPTDGRFPVLHPLGDCKPALIAWPTPERVLVSCVGPDRTVTRTLAVAPATGASEAWPSPMIGARGTELVTWDEERLHRADPAGTPTWTAPPDTLRLAVAPDGTRAVLSQRERLVLVDVEKGTELAEWPTDDAPAYQLAFSPDGTWFAAARQENVHVYGTDGSHWTSKPAHSSKVLALASRADGTTVTGDMRGVRIVWRAGATTRIPAPEPIRLTEQHDPSPMSDTKWISLSDDGTRGVSLHEDRVEVFSLDGRSLRLLRRFDLDAAPGDVIEVGKLERGGGCFVEMLEFASRPALDATGRRVLHGVTDRDYRPLVDLVDVDSGERLGRWRFTDIARSTGFDAGGRPVVWAGTRVLRLGEADPEVLADDVEGAWLDGPGGRMAWVIDGQLTVDGQPRGAVAGLEVLGWQGGRLIARELGDGPLGLVALEGAARDDLGDCDLDRPFAMTVGYVPSAGCVTGDDSGWLSF